MKKKSIVILAVCLWIFIFCSVVLIKYNTLEKEEQLMSIQKKSRKLLQKIEDSEFCPVPNQNRRRKSKLVSFLLA